MSSWGMGKLWLGCHVCPMKLCNPRLNDHNSKSVIKSLALNFLNFNKKHSHGVWSYWLLWPRTCWSFIHESSMSTLSYRSLLFAVCCSGGQWETAGWSLMATRRGGEGGRGLALPRCSVSVMRSSWAGRRFQIIQRRRLFSDVQVFHYLLSPLL